jgi:hypothetical protein
VGRLYYGSDGTGIEMPDRTLGYLRTIATTKLRRSESFTVSWRGGPEGGRTTIWLHSSIPLRFEFSSPMQEALDRQELEKLAQAANSSGGVTFDLAQPQERELQPAMPHILERAA